MQGPIVAVYVQLCFKGFVTGPQNIVAFRLTVLLKYPGPGDTFENGHLFAYPWPLNNLHVDLQPESPEKWGPAFVNVIMLLYGYQQIIIMEPKLVWLHDNSQ